MTFGSKSFKLKRKKEGDMKKNIKSVSGLSVGRSLNGSVSSTRAKSLKRKI